MMPDTERVWIPDNSGAWVVLDRDTTILCRFNGGSPRRQCRQRAVVQLLRQYTRSDSRWWPYCRHIRIVSRWWPYCADHMYGRRIRYGRVEYQIAADSPAAQRGELW